MHESSEGHLTSTLNDQRFHDFDFFSRSIEIEVISTDWFLHQHFAFLTSAPGTSAFNNCPLSWFSDCCIFFTSAPGTSAFYNCPLGRWIDCCVFFTSAPGTSAFNNRPLGRWINKVSTKSNSTISEISFDGFADQHLWTTFHLADSTTAVFSSECPRHECDQHPSTWLIELICMFFPSAPGTIVFINRPLGRFCDCCLFLPSAPGTSVFNIRPHGRSSLSVLFFRVPPARVCSTSVHMADRATRNNLPLGRFCYCFFSSRVPPARVSSWIFHIL